MTLLCSSRGSLRWYRCCAFHSSSVSSTLSTRRGQKRRRLFFASSSSFDDDNIIEEYRALPLDNVRLWGTNATNKKKSTSLLNEPTEGQYVSLKAKLKVQNALDESENTCRCLQEYAKTIVYDTECIESKIALTHRAFGRFLRGEIEVIIAEKEDKDFPSRPARPAKPTLVMPFSVPSPKNTPLSSFSAHVLHTVAHIELNAIDLAWDTVSRFRGLPREFYLDFARVADDESRHLSWCLQRLEELGHEYGEMDAHDMLWLGCFESREDTLDRMAVVPMAQEARGLDAGPRLREKLVGRGDNRSAAIVERITKEELNHVAVGVHWFREICAREENIERGNEEELGKRFLSAVERCAPDVLKGPFAHEERERAGMSREWYDLNYKNDPDLRRRLEVMVKMEEANSSE
ncbi:unnamed protein product [Bathycoccus prasinos]